VKKKLCGIYQIQNIITHIKYIGSSKNISQRWNNHKTELNNKVHKNSYLQNAWKKYGKENFKFEIIKTCKEENLLIIEQFYLDKYKNNRKKLYNVSFDARRPELTEEQKKIISKKAKIKGTLKNPIIREKIKKTLQEKYSKKIFFQTPKVIELYENKMSLDKIKKILNVSRKTIKYILNHNNIKIRTATFYLKNKPKTEQQKLKISNNLKAKNFKNNKLSEFNKMNIGEKNNFSKLTTQEVIEIKKLLSIPTSRQKIANKFNVSKATINCISWGKTWKHIKLEN